MLKLACLFVGAYLTHLGTNALYRDVLLAETRTDSEQMVEREAIERREGDLISRSVESVLGPNARVVSAVADDLDFDGRKEWIAFVRVDVQHPSGPEDVVRWLVVFVEMQNGIEVIARSRVKGMRSDGTIVRTQLFFPEKERVIHLQSSESARPGTLNQVFRYSRNGLTQVKFHEDGKKLIQIRGGLELQRNDPVSMAKLSFGEGLRDRSIFRWKGDHYQFEPMAVPPPKKEDLAIIERVETYLQAKVFAAEIYSRDRVLVYSQKGIHWYYHLLRINEQITEIEPDTEKRLGLEHESYLVARTYSDLNEASLRNYVLEKGQFVRSVNSVIDKNPK